MGVGEPKLITWRDDVGGLEGDLRAGQLAAQGFAQAFAQRFAARRVGLQRDLDDGFLRPAGEQVNQVHRVAGGHHARRNRW